MIRLFASDMDGTLLNDKGYISDRTINAVKKLQKHGIHFIVSAHNTCGLCPFHGDFKAL